MRQSKKQLLQRIQELEKELRNEKFHSKRSALVDKANLPKCKSLACAGCRHIIYQHVPGLGTILLGCGKDLACPDFEEPVIPRPDISQEYQLLLEQGLQSQ